MMPFIFAALLLFSIEAHSEKLEIASQSLSFLKTGHPQYEIKKAVFLMRCARQKSAWERLSGRDDEIEKCSGFYVNGTQDESPIRYWDLNKDEDGNFQTPHLTIEYSSENKGHLCLSVFVEIVSYPLFSTVPFLDPLDSYALLNYCTVDELPVDHQKNIFNHKRIRSLKDFLNIMNKGIYLRLHNNTKSNK